MIEEACATLLPGKSYSYSERSSVLVLLLESMTQKLEPVTMHDSKLRHSSTSTAVLSTSTKSGDRLEAID